MTKKDPTRKRRKKTGSESKNIDLQRFLEERDREKGGIEYRNK
jgi:hypothetical protein